MESIIKFCGGVLFVILLSMGCGKNMASPIPPGNTGEPGARGEQGFQGEQGTGGAQGEQGLAGAQGQQGQSGAQGSSGSQGPQGEQGEQGEQGIAGAGCEIECITRKKLEITCGGVTIILEGKKCRD